MGLKLAKALLCTKCPRCRKGEMFTSVWYNLLRFHVMNKTCAYCGVSFHPEPGFYQGAMYVSYGFTVLVTVFVFGLVSLLKIHSFWFPIVSLVTIMFLLVPVNYRYSRVIYLYLFGGIKHDSTIL